ncbi:uncharacterized protein LOC106131151 [Amyelois transitella]|uniref:uncharacterized protein LOC106131151 n=1 Tax=Amyelois transitella TaxID=680683 RepID=UPI00067B4D46|nr:uncharacterized protein LOC106131151 [Amyelois transitella]
MIIRCGLLLLFLSFVKTTENHPNQDELVGSSDLERIFSYSFWPSVHNGAKMMKLRKRQVQDPKVLNEAGDVKSTGNSSANPTVPIQPSDEIHKSNLTPKLDTSITVNSTSNNQSAVSTQNLGNTTDKVVMPAMPEDETKHNGTTTKTMPADLNNPGVLTRALIVFGGFALMAGAYLIFYRRKGKNNDTNSTHGINDANQFRYGILQSDDRRDNLELSRVPLTMESDEDEEDDLEIFDLEQKKKSLSYVNLQTNDEDVVFSSENNRQNDRDNLLLDIEDASIDTSMDWVNNGNKSIL